MQVKTDTLRIECVTGDIARQADMDAVVNAANAQLMPGGGVAGALHAAAGPELARACAPLAPIHPGQAVITQAFNLPNRHVIHCLGPVYGRDEPSDRLLENCYRQALALAQAHDITSIAFPAISTGAFGYPLEAAARIAVQSVADAARTTMPTQGGLHIRFVLHEEHALAAFTAALESLRIQGEA